MCRPSRPNYNQHHQSIFVNRHISHAIQRFSRQTTSQKAIPGLGTPLKLPSNLESIFPIQTVGASRPLPSQRLSHLKQSPKPKSIRLHKTPLYRNTPHLAIQLDLEASSLLTNPPTDHNDLLSAYNSNLSDRLNKHAPVITKLETHATNPRFNSFLQGLKSSRRRLERAYKQSGDLDILKKLKTLTNRYHSQLLSAKKRYLSSLVHSNSSNPRNLWQTLNNLLHRYCPFSLESPSTFSSCFSPIIQSFYVLITPLNLSLFLELVEPKAPLFAYGC